VVGLVVEGAQGFCAPEDEGLLDIELGAVEEGAQGFCAPEAEGAQGFCAEESEAWTNMLTEDLAPLAGVRTGVMATASVSSETSFRVAFIIAIL
jgi:hypothetical protein